MYIEKVTEKNIKKPLLAPHKKRGELEPPKSIPHHISY